MAITLLDGSFGEKQVHQEACVIRATRLLALDRFTNRPGVIRIETSIIFAARRRCELPVLQMED